MNATACKSYIRFLNLQRLFPEGLEEGVLGAEINMFYARMTGSPKLTKEMLEVHKGEPGTTWDFAGIPTDLWPRSYLRLSDLKLVAQYSICGCPPPKEYQMSTIEIIAPGTRVRAVRTYTLQSRAPKTTEFTTVLEGEVVACTVGEDGQPQYDVLALREGSKLRELATVHIVPGISSGWTIQPCSEAAQ